MATTTPTHSDNDQIDRLSSLPEALQVTILSFLPTHMAARTSVLSRGFRHLWEASPCLNLDCRQFTPPAVDKFVDMADRAILRRDPSHSLLSLRIDFHYMGTTKPSAFLLCLFVKARSLGLRHLAIEGSWLLDFTDILPVIFSMDTLLSLSLDRFPVDSDISPQSDFSFGITLTSLTSLSLRLDGRFEPNLAKLNDVLSRLCSLEDLQLEIKAMSDSLILSSQTIRKLTVILIPAAYDFQSQLDNVDLSLPALESLHFESDKIVPHFNKEFPSLKKAVISLCYVRERDIGGVAELLNCVSPVEELSLNVFECSDEKSPIPILQEPGKFKPAFPNLKNLDATICFHKHNIKAIVTMLANAPALQSLELKVQVPEFTHWIRGSKRKDWELKFPRKKKDSGFTLPRNAEAIRDYAYFRNLHLDDNKKGLMKSLSVMCI